MKPNSAIFFDKNFNRLHKKEIIKFHTFKNFQLRTAGIPIIFNRLMKMYLVRVCKRKRQGLWYRPKYTSF